MFRSLWVTVIVSYLTAVWHQCQAPAKWINVNATLPKRQQTETERESGDKEKRGRERGKEVVCKKRTQTLKRKRQKTSAKHLHGRDMEWETDRHKERRWVALWRTQKKLIESSTPPKHTRCPPLSSLTHSSIAQQGARGQTDRWVAEAEWWMSGVGGSTVWNKNEWKSMAATPGASACWRERTGEERRVYECVSVCVLGGG